MLLEKSPPNLVRMRFLQALFPQASFVVVVRHPVVVALGTKKWARTTSWTTLMANWFAAHETFLEDATRIHRLHAVRYEDFAADPARVLAEIAAFAGLDGEVPSDSVQAQRSVRYAQIWHGWERSANPWLRARHRRLCRRFGARGGPLRLRPARPGRPHPPDRRDQRPMSRADRPDPRGAAPRRCTGRRGMPVGTRTGRRSAARAASPGRSP